MAALSVIGTVGMVLAVGVAVGKLCLMDGPLKPTELIHKPDDFYTPFVALLDIIFTYGGQASQGLCRKIARSHWLFEKGDDTIVSNDLGPHMRGGPIRRLR